jgi:hypothetical protein
VFVSRAQDYLVLPQISETECEGTSGGACRRRWTEGRGTGTVPKVKHKTLSSMHEFHIRFSYNYVQVKKKNRIQNSILHSILYSRFPPRVCTFIYIYIYIHHHRLKAITHIKYSLNFAMRHLCDANGDARRLWMPDERRREISA